MARNKELKKAEFNNFPNCVNDDTSLRGKWSEFFGNDNPIVLEVGCGKADLGYGLALRHPKKNILGLDIKAVRMWVGAFKALQNGVKNIGFLRCDIHGVGQYFAPEEVSEIWVTFPDPYPRKKHAKNRLVQKKFLLQYREMLGSGGTVFFKTDNDGLFEWALEHWEELNQGDEIKVELLASTRDLHGSELKNEDNGLITDYERRFMDEGQKINYAAFRLH